MVQLTKCFAAFTAVHCQLASTLVLDPASSPNPVASLAQRGVVTHKVGPFKVDTVQVQQTQHRKFVNLFKGFLQYSALGLTIQCVLRDIIDMREFLPDCLQHYDYIIARVISSAFLTGMLYYVWLIQLSFVETVNATAVGANPQDKKVQRVSGCEVC